MADQNPMVLGLALGFGIFFGGLILFCICWNFMFGRYFFKQFKLLKFLKIL